MAVVLLGQCIANFYIGRNELVGRSSMCVTEVANAQERVALGNIHSLTIVAGEKSQWIRRHLDIK